MGETLIHQQGRHHQLRFLVQNRNFLLRYIRGDQSVNFLSGWRYQILKEELENAK
jgi:hypothetical protein